MTWQRIVDDERGQSSVMIVSLLLIFVLFTAMVANVGQAVNRRIALQIVADAGAWTGATNQAIGLNKMAELNLYKQAFWTALTQAESGFTAPPCVVAIPALEAYEGLTLIATLAFEEINWTYAFVAHQEANRVTTYNLADLFPGEDPSAFTVTGPGALRLPGCDLTHCWAAAEELATTFKVPDGMISAIPGSWSPARREAEWVCITPEGMPEPMTGEFELWEMRINPGETDFWWYVKAPAARALLFDELFGPDAIPEMEAVSAAKPMGGSILWGLQQYVTKLIPVADAVEGDEEWRAESGSETGDSVYDEYRGIIRMITH